MTHAFRAALVAAAVLLTGASAAKADFVDWYGAGLLTSLSNCPTGNLAESVNRIFHARFLPSGIGTNGSNSSLSFLNQHYAQGYMVSGPFNSSFKTATAQTIARFNGPSGYPVKVKFTSQSPATITATTPMIQVQGQITGFSGFPNNNNCTANFSVTLFKS